MRKIRACLRFAVFVIATLAVYSFWWMTRYLFLTNSFGDSTFLAVVEEFCLDRQMKIEIIGTPPKPPFFLVCNHLVCRHSGVKARCKGYFVAKRHRKLARPGRSSATWEWYLSTARSA